VVVIAVFVLFLTYMTMCLGEKLMKVLGVIGMNVLTRVFGVIVAALATQHIVHGVTAVVKSMR
jgi:multiple antibiotic resistance protein